MIETAYVWALYLAAFFAFFGERWVQFVTWVMDHGWLDEKDVISESRR